MNKKLNNFQELENNELSDLEFDTNRVKQSVESNVINVRFLSGMVELYFSNMVKSLMHLLSSGEDSSRIKQDNLKDQ